MLFPAPNSPHPSIRWMSGLLTLLLACLLTPALAQETCGTDPATSPNHSDNYSFTVNVLRIFTLQYTAGPGGTLTGDASQTVTQGENGSPVTAIPAAGYHFTGWDDGITSATRTAPPAHA